MEESLKLLEPLYYMEASLTLLEPLYCMEESLKAAGALVGSCWGGAVSDGRCHTR